MIFSHTKFIEILEALFTESVPFSDALDWIIAADAEICKDAEHLTKLFQESDYYEVSPDEVELGLTGLMNYQEALVAVHDFIVDEWDEGLEVAVEKVQEAQLLLKQALVLNAAASTQVSFEALC